MDKTWKFLIWLLLVWSLYFPWLPCVCYSSFDCLDWISSKHWLPLELYTRFASKETTLICFYFRNTLQHVYYERVCWPVICDPSSLPGPLHRGICRERMSSLGAAPHPHKCWQNPWYQRKHCWCWHCGQICLSHRPWDSWGPRAGGRHTCTHHNYNTSSSGTWVNNSEKIHQTSNIMVLEKLEQVFFYLSLKSMSWNLKNICCKFIMLSCYSNNESYYTFSVIKIAEKDEYEWKHATELGQTSEKTSGVNCCVECGKQFPLSNAANYKPDDKECKCIQRTCKN